MMRVTSLAATAASDVPIEPDEEGGPIDPNKPPPPPPARAVKPW